MNEIEFLMAAVINRYFPEIQATFIRHIRRRREGKLKGYSSIVFAYQSRNCSGSTLLLRISLEIVLYVALASLKFDFLSKLIIKVHNEDYKILFNRQYKVHNNLICHLGHDLTYVIWYQNNIKCSQISLHQHTIDKIERMLYMEYIPLHWNN